MRHGSKMWPNPPREDLDINDYVGERVRIAYNLTQCSWNKPVLEGEKCFSVRHGKGWKVQGYTDRLFLKDVEFKVSAATHNRVRKVKQREVYAFIVGTVVKPPKGSAYKKWPEITFNPFKDDTFVMRDGRKPVTSCTGAYFDGRTVRCGGADLAKNGSPRFIANPMRSYLGERVRIAYNITKCSWDKPVVDGEECFSIRLPPKWKVEDYTAKIYLKNIKFVVSKGTHERVRKMQRRKVYAFIEGDVAPIPKNTSKWPKLSFNPFKDDTFVLLKGNQRLPLASCDGIIFDGRDVRCKNPVVANYARNGKASSLDKSIKIREDFRDEPHSQVRQMRWSWPKELVEVGDCEAVLYKSDKWQSDGKMIDYKHVAEGPQKLLIRADAVAKGDGAQFFGPTVDLAGEFPDSFAELAQCLGIQARLYSDDDGKKYWGYGDLRFPKSKLAAGKFEDGGTFCFVYDSSGVLAVVIGAKLDVLKDGIVG